MKHGRLVDADSLISLVQDSTILGDGFKQAFVAIVKGEPTIEPEIIACGDCKHWICHDRRCGYWNHGVKPLMWCSQAERREE